MFLSYTFLSNRVENILLGLVFRKKNWCSGWHVFEDFKLGALQQHVLRNASLLCCGAWVPSTTEHGFVGGFLIFSTDMHNLFF